ncbi:MAG: RNA methyltransferase [Clostridia bacterium]|nr:RNA methyltransferase [Clostridia bacterium]
MIRVIESVNNPTLKELCKKVKSPSADCFFLEGTRFVEELPVDCVLEVYTSDPKKHEAFLKTLPKERTVYYLSAAAMKKLCSAVSDQTIACTVRRIPTKRPHKLVLLDGVQDPGNVGTVIRTAYAFGFGVVLFPGCANPWSPKTLMSTAGAFRSCHIESTQDPLAFLQELKADGFSVFATALDPTAVPPEEISFGENRAVIIGSEGKGVSPEVLKNADQTVFIPMQNPINSLNAASAASIMIYALK